MTSTRQKLVRFATVGLLSNLALYVLYLVLTSAGLGHKVAMTIAYGLGILQTFALNRAYTFQHGGPIGSSLSRFLTAALVGFTLNFAALAVFVDGLGAPHQVVQGLAILGVAALMFILQQRWVFPGPAPSQLEGHTP